jgi:hypothetical protein
MQNFPGLGFAPGCPMEHLLCSWRSSSDYALVPYSWNYVQNMFSEGQCKKRARLLTLR